MDPFLDTMANPYGLSGLSVALVLMGVAALATLVAYLAEERGAARLFPLLTIVLVLALDPTTGPFRRT